MFGKRSEALLVKIIERTKENVFHCTCQRENEENLPSSPCITFLLTTITVLTWYHFTGHYHHYKTILHTALMFTQAISIKGEKYYLNGITSPLHVSENQEGILAKQVVQATLNSLDKSLQT